MYFFEYYISKEKIKLDMNYKNSVFENINLLKKISKKFSINYSIIIIEKLTLSKSEKILENIRILSRKKKICVSTKDGSGPLPISRNKKINVNGLLLCFINNKLENIYPYLLNKKRVEINQSLNNFIENNTLQDENYLTENDILKVIETFPNLISNNLIFIGDEIEVEGGRIDCVFKDKITNYHILIEIEIYAKSIAIEQCLKFKKSYSLKYNINIENIKLAIICGSIKRSTFKAAKTCGIEVYILNLKKL